VNAVRPRAAKSHRSDWFVEARGVRAGSCRDCRPADAAWHRQQPGADRPQHTRPLALDGLRSRGPTRGKVSLQENASATSGPAAKGTRRLAWRRRPGMRWQAWTPLPDRSAPAPGNGDDSGLDDLQHQRRCRHQAKSRIEPDSLVGTAHFRPRPQGHTKHITCPLQKASAFRARCGVIRFCLTTREEVRRQWRAARPEAGFLQPLSGKTAVSAAASARPIWSRARVGRISTAPSLEWKRVALRRRLNAVARPQNEVRARFTGSLSRPRMEGNGLRRGSYAPTISVGAR
jgi:hypothetical protein